MIKNKSLLCVLMLLKNNEVWAYPSLFFTDEEIKYIHENVISKNAKSVENFEKLYLSAIVYVDEAHWSLWINDKIIRPENAAALESVYIERVNPQKVWFSWTTSGTTTLSTFTLRPYQTYIANHRKLAKELKN